MTLSSVPQRTERRDGDAAGAVALFGQPHRLDADAVSRRDRSAPLSRRLRCGPPGRPAGRAGRRRALPPSPAGRCCAADRAIVDRAGRPDARRTCPRGSAKQCASGAAACMAMPPRRRAKGRRHARDRSRARSSRPGWPRHNRRGSCPRARGRFRRSPDNRTPPRAARAEMLELRPPHAFVRADAVEEDDWRRVAVAGFLVADRDAGRGHDSEP